MLKIDVKSNAITVVRSSYFFSVFSLSLNVSDSFIISSNFLFSSNFLRNNFTLFSNFVNVFCTENEPKETIFNVYFWEIKDKRPSYNYFILRLIHTRWFHNDMVHFIQSFFKLFVIHCWFIYTTLYDRGDRQ